MEVVKKKLHKLPNNKKLAAIKNIISELENIRNTINNNSNGNILLDFIGLNREEIKDELDDLNEECKLVEDYPEDKLNFMKDEILTLNYKLNCVKNILNVTVKKDEDYDHNEGWKTTSKDTKITIELKNGMKIQINFSYQYNGYDSSTDFYKYVYIYKNDKSLEKNKDYYIEDKYYNGKKVNKKTNPVGNLESKIKQYCKKNNIDFNNLPENEVINILNNIKKENQKIQEEYNIHEKSKNTFWTFFTNLILEKLKDEDEFEEFFYKLDNN